MLTRKFAVTLAYGQQLTIVRSSKLSHRYQCARLSFDHERVGRLSTTPGTVGLFYGKHITEVQYTFMGSLSRYLHLRGNRD
jgi:hypothetical protein